MCLYVIYNCFWYYSVEKNKEVLIQTQNYPVCYMLTAFKNKHSHILEKEWATMANNLNNYEQ